MMDRIFSRPLEGSGETPSAFPPTDDSAITSIPNTLSLAIRTANFPIFSSPLSFGYFFTTTSAGIKSGALLEEVGEEREDDGCETERGIEEEDAEEEDAVGGIIGQEVVVVKEGHEAVVVVLIW